MTLQTTKTHVVHGGTLRYMKHDSAVTGTPMTLSVFTPPGEGPFPVLIWLSGLTCTEDNFTTKAGAYRAAAEHGLVVVAPDTSPRGEGVADDPAYDLGQGAVSAHRMARDGALTLALRHPDLFKSVSAFAPIGSPTRCPWGEKAFAAYLGPDRAAWAEHDAALLLASGAARGVYDDILVDQGDADSFLADQLKPELLQAAADTAGQTITLRMQPGYDHSYFFMASFIADHIAFHASRLKT